MPSVPAGAAAVFRYSWLAALTTITDHGAGRIMRTLFVSFALAVAAAGLSGAALAQDSVRAQDRAEIEALMWRYARALDTFDADAYAAVYTEDGEFKAGGTATKGRDALRQMVA